MSVINYNKNQLVIGQTVASDINDRIDSYVSSMSDSINNIKDAGKQYKVNLDSTIDVTGINEGFSNITDYISNANDLAVTQAGIADQYEAGELDKAAMMMHSTPEEYVANLFSSKSNMLNPDAPTKVAATIGMGIFKFGEGFTEFFEDIGDGVITLGAGAASLLGHEDAAKSMAQFAQRDLSVELWENNDTFRWINKNSYFDKDSKFANFCKFGGKVTGAVVVGSVASNLYTLRAGAAGGNAVEAAELASKATSVSNKVSKVSSLFGNGGSSAVSNLGNGHDIKAAVALGSLEAAASFGAGKYISAPIGKAVGKKVSETVLGDSIRKADSKATEVFGTKVKDVAVKFGDRAVETSIKTGEKETTSNLVHDDGNEKSVEDTVAEKGANRTIDTVKKSVDKTIEHSLEKSVEQTAEKTTEKVVENTAKKIAEKTAEETAESAAESAVKKAVKETIIKAIV